MLALGGSNTANFYGTRDTDFLKNAIFKLCNESVREITIINEGIPGTGPTMKNFEFERDPLRTWPNVVSLEFAVNSENSWHHAKKLDQLIHFLSHKWEKNGLIPPNYFLIELFRIEPYYPYSTFYHWAKVVYNKSMEQPDSSGAARLTPSVENPSDYAFNRGTLGGAVMMALARFYSFPVLSAADSMFPAFTRYYSTFANTSIWPYFEDGLHLNKMGGELFLSRVVAPFFQQALRQRDSDRLPGNKSSIYSFDLRMFPFGVYEGSVLASWRSWGPFLSEHLKFLVEGAKPYANSTWDFIDLRNHHDGLHRCYGSFRQKDTARLGFLVQGLWNCNSERSCRVSIGLLHSWNSSYVGQASCALYKHKEQRDSAVESQLGSTVRVHGSLHRGRRARDTTVREVSLTEGAVLETGFYVAECTNLEEGKLTCIASLSVTSK